MPGFGTRPFGDEPFGDIDWCKIVLWEEMPPDIKDQDAEAGYPYRNFVEALAPSFQWLRNHIARFKTIIDPREMRSDLLLYFGDNFGITIDLAEPESYQRMRAALAARWNIIKGTIESYVVLCRVHGFEVDVQSLWWDGVSFSETGPTIFNESSTYLKYDLAGPTTRYRIWLNCKPVVPGEVSVDIGGATSFVDDGDGGLTGVDVLSGTIDYGWGYIDVTLDGSFSDDPSSTYESVVGGCISSCDKCKTHRIRLDITPGTISGQSELTITEAYQRLYGKLGVLTGDGVIPVHVELEYYLYDEEIIFNIGNHYDALIGDTVPTDTGMHFEVV